jgi:hypothetical protein
MPDKDSSNSMQRGRALPAAARRSGTSIFADGENANEPHHPPHKKGVLQNTPNKNTSADPERGWLMCLFAVKLN